MEANTPQFRNPAVQNHDQIVDTPVKITCTDGGTTNLEANQLVVEVVPPATGVHTINLPFLSKWKNRTIRIYSETDAPGGAVLVKVRETATDAVGDNLTANGDVVVLFNAQGEYVHVDRDVTT